MDRGIAVAAALLIVLGSGALAAAQDGDRGYQGYGPDDRERKAQQADSTFERDGDTFVGDHVAFTLDEDRPGVTGYRILDGNDTVLRTVTLPGDEARWSVHEDRFTMHTPQAHLMIRDHESYRLGADVEEDDRDGPSTQAVPEVRLTVAQGVEVSENENWSSGDDRVYDLTVGDHELKVTGDDLAYEDGAFRAREEAMLGADFPGDRERERPETRPAEDRRERGSQWDRSGDDFQGEHVRFTKDESLPGVVDVRPQDPEVQVLDEIVLPGGEEVDWQSHGRSFVMRTPEAHLRVVDVPPVVMNLDASDGGEATIVLAEGITAEEVPVRDDDAPENASMYELHLPGNRTAWLGGSDAVFHPADPANGTQARLVVDGMSIGRLAPDHGPRPGGHEEEPDADRERRGPPDDPGAAELDVEARQQVDQAAATGKVGVEVHPDDGEATAVEMGHVSVQEAEGPDGEVKAGVTVEAPDDAPGTVVRFSLNSSALEGVDVTEVPDALTVRYDNDTIEAADDLDDVLDWSDDGGEPEYLLLVGGQEVEVLVSVPHFSPHTIEVVETASSGAESVDGAPGPGAVAALVAGLAAAAARRR